MVQKTLRKGWRSKAYFFVWNLAPGCEDQKAFRVLLKTASFSLLEEGEGDALIATSVRSSLYARL